ncbi:hypothetical protein BO78DRAFT_368612 [Aspergillus sclerotiicarbonarius CBS 121057]|uniref:Secreted protein n=1 Tax=Aspergillus sclerotiicarbonarius (strain CBS 121057 / IBT 28362) TaxID=1448318 RepID=A0A319EX07_ASPSB|nr:hypothetical protein BO78DRAFT_368612 [Aspergillus sclerotiicarbonarius CBS 121057]
MLAVFYCHVAALLSFSFLLVCKFYCVQGRPSSVSERRYIEPAWLWASCHWPYQHTDIPVSLSSGRSRFARWTFAGCLLGSSLLSPLFAISLPSCCRVAIGPAPFHPSCCLLRPFPLGRE